MTCEIGWWSEENECDNLEENRDLEDEATDRGLRLAEAHTMLIWYLRDHVGGQVGSRDFEADWEKRQLKALEGHAELCRAMAFSFKYTYDV